VPSRAAPRAPLTSPRGVWRVQGFRRDLSACISSSSSQSRPCGALALASRLEDCSGRQFSETPASRFRLVPLPCATPQSTHDAWSAFPKSSRDAPLAPLLTSLPSSVFLKLLNPARAFYVINRLTPIHAFCVSPQAILHSFCEQIFRHLVSVCFHIQGAPFDLPLYVIFVSKLELAIKKF
jgi:hypothetical protein